ncbi:MAG: MOSC domain-containing protein [Candidatus Zixiibacteriota bacterium]|nr:MAG: MOSC domain-containing protein [candidate division Zixibacteria bacterium]
MSVSGVKCEKKENVKSVTVTAEGIKGDAHLGSSRALSLLPFESFDKLSNDKLMIRPGDFGENITTIGLDFGALRVGTKIALGDKVVLEVVQVGKECHDGCFIKQTVGDCIMPREGLFARVIMAGELKEGDSIRIIE